MTFSYREVTVSGNLAGTEGTSKLIQEIKTSLVDEMGWTLTDDQTNRAGTNHQLTLQSNGELNNYPTFYLTLTSGTGINTAVGQDVVNFRIATAWDAATHRIATSGTGSPVASGSSTLNIDSNGLSTVWISGDKDAVTFVTMVGNTYDGAHAGLINQFTSTVFDRFPVYLIGGSTSAVDSLSNSTNEVFSFFDATNPLVGGEVDAEAFFTTPLGTDQTPNNIFGSTEAYVAFPLVMGVSDTAPVRKSVRGFSKNIWVTVASGGVGSVVNLRPEDEILSGDGRVYKVFFDSLNSTRSVVIRRS